MFDFAWPWLFAFLPIPFLFRKLLKAYERQDNALKVPFFQRINFDSTSFQKNSSESFFALTLLTIAWVCLVASAAQPRITGDAIELPSSGRDLMLAVDVSSSMRTDDMILDQRRFPRIVVVKSILKDFLEKREGDRVGLILFGTNAYLQAPLTFDLNTVSQFIDEAVLGIAGRNTAIGDAIGLAIKRLKDRPESQRILILLTDGANTAGTDPLETIELANISKVKVYTIGVEAESRWQRSGLDESTLSKLASETGGQYFRARNPQELAQIYAKLDEIEEIKQSGQFFRPQKSLYYYPLTGCILTTLIVLSLPFFQQLKSPLKNE